MNVDDRMGACREKGRMWGRGGAFGVVLVATRSIEDFVEQTGRTPTRTSTRPPHPLHSTPCPYRTLGRKHLNGYDYPIRSSTFIRCAVSVYDTLDILLKCIIGPLGRCDGVRI